MAIFIGFGIPSDPLAWAQAETPIRPLRDLADERERHNRLHRELNDPSPRPSGIACPKCDGGELVIDRPGWINACNPPSQWATCNKCSNRTTIPA